MVTSGEMAGVSNGWRGAPGTFGKLRAGVSLDEVEWESWSQIQPYDLKLPEFGALYLLKPKNLHNPTSETEVSEKKKKIMKKYKDLWVVNFGGGPLCRSRRDAWCLRILWICGWGTLLWPLMPPFSTLLFVSALPKQIGRRNGSLCRGLEWMGVVVKESWQTKVLPALPSGQSYFSTCISLSKGIDIIPNKLVLFN